MSETSSRKTILVIEDDAAIRDAVLEWMSMEGFEVLCAENGAAGLDILRRGARPCLILLDLMMPVMDGFQFLAIRATEPQINSIPVLVLSAYPRREFESDVAEFIKKPVDLPSLTRIIRKWCR